METETFQLAEVTGAGLAHLGHLHLPARAKARLRHAEDVTLFAQANIPLGTSYRSKTHSARLKRLNSFAVPMRRIDCQAGLGLMIPSSNSSTSLAPPGTCT